MRLFNDNLQFLRVTKLILSMLSDDIELNPGPRYDIPCKCSGSQGESDKITPEFVGKMVYS